LSIGAAPQLQRSPAATTVLTAEVVTDGRPLAGADYVLRAWPSASVLAEQPDGELVRTVTLATGVTNRRGEVRVAVDSAVLGRDFVDDDTVNFELGIGYGSQEATWNFPATRAAAGGASPQHLWSNPNVSREEAAVHAGLGLGPVHLSIDLGERPSIVERGNEPSSWINDDGRTLQGTEVVAVSAVQLAPRTSVNTVGDVSLAESCYYIAQNNWQYGRGERFIHAIGTAQAPPTVLQTTSSSHTMGVAYRSSGTASWSQSGTSTATTGASDSRYLGTSVRVYNTVNYRQYRYSCNHGVSYTGQEQWRPVSINALNAGRDIISRPNWTGGCTTYSNGTRSKTQGSNVTFATGVTLSFFSVSAKSSFSVSTALRWDFTGPAKLCGSSSLGWVSAPQAGAYVP
jgi:hypothetical protein